MRYLFLLTITPVQDFISQARKLKDLFAGSNILSKMAEVGINYSEKQGGSIIFPQKIPQKIDDVKSYPNRYGNVIFPQRYRVIFPQKIDDVKSYPNRFLLEISFECEDELRVFANNVSNEIINYFKQLNNRNSLIINQQIDKFFQIYWSASEYTDNYQHAFDTVEKRLAAAKNGRFFSQLDEEAGRKCSVCGERNIAVFRGKKDMRFYIKSQRDKLIHTNSNNLLNKEGLCGICSIKRFFHSNSRFQSVSDIAIMNIPEPIRQKYHNLNKDSQLFYEENLTKDYFAKNGLPYEKLDKCKEELDSFKKETKDFKQTSYYAVIMFDADDMGQWLSGQNLKNHSELKQFHQDISCYLAQFTKVARNILKPKGETIYAGGEDFLGFVNLQHLFEVLTELNRKFKTEISNKIIQKQAGKQLTFSAGVVIAHYKTPLSYVLNEIRQSEKRAKRNAGKDSICLTVLKHSGERRESVLQFSKLPNLTNITEQLKQNFSASFIPKLDEEFLRMCCEQEKPGNNLNPLLNAGKFDNKLNSLVYAEIKRLLKRSLKDDLLKDDDKNKKIDEMVQAIKAIHTQNFRNFVDGLYICRFLNKEIG